MRAAFPNLDNIKSNECYPMNVQYEITGHVLGDVRSQLQGISDSLLDWIRNWIFDNEEEAYAQLYKRLDFLLNLKYVNNAGVINENVSFIILF